MVTTQRMTKEELQKDNVLLRNQVKEANEKDEEMRKEFAKAFDWYEERTREHFASGQRKLETPSWHQIFREIGRLQASQNALCTAEQIATLRTEQQNNWNKIEELQKKIDN